MGFEGREKKGREKNRVKKLSPLKAAAAATAAFTALGDAPPAHAQFLSYGEKSAHADVYEGVTVAPDQSIQQLLGHQVNQLGVEFREFVKKNHSALERRDETTKRRALDLMSRVTRWETDATPFADVPVGEGKFEYQTEQNETIHGLVVKILVWDKPEEETNRKHITKYYLVVPESQSRKVEIRNERSDIQQWTPHRDPGSKSGAGISVMECPERLLKFSGKHAISLDKSPVQTGQVAMAIVGNEVIAPFMLGAEEEPGKRMVVIQHEDAVKIHPGIRLIEPKEGGGYAVDGMIVTEPKPFPLDGKTFIVAGVADRRAIIDAINQIPKRN